MALTLIEAAKGITNPYERGMIETFTSGAMALQWIPFNTVTTGTYKYVQEETLPTVNFEGINESYTEVNGVINPVQETTSRLGVDVATDLELISSMGMQVHDRNVAMVLKSMSHRYVKEFFRGDLSVDNASFDGLNKRLPEAASTQALATAGASNALSLNSIDELIDRVDGDGKVLVMRKKLRRALTTAARNSGLGGYITHTQDQFGRQITMYGGLPIIEADQNGAKYEAITNTEGSGDKTSVWCLALGDGQLWGMQKSTISAREMGEKQTKPQLLTRIDWSAGLVLEHPRSIGRCYDIDETAAVVA